MHTHRDPKELALDLLARSRCDVQVAAVISDNHGIFSWGHNHELHGKGFHAEHKALRRSNRKRLKGSRLTVAARRRKSGNVICARPCEKRKFLNRSHVHSCMELAKKYGIKIIEYTIHGGGWEKIHL